MSDCKVCPNYNIEFDSCKINEDCYLDQISYNRAIEILKDYTVPTFPLPISREEWEKAIKLAIESMEDWDSIQNDCYEENYQIDGTDLIFP